MKGSIISFGVIVLLSFIISSDALAQPRQKFQKKFSKDNMIEKLNLTDEQKDKISELRTANQKEMIDLKAELEKKMVDMRELRKNPDLKRADLISAVGSINSIRDKIAIVRANHGMDVFEILTPEQKKIWQEHKPMMREHMKMKYKDRGRGFDGFGFNDFQPGPKFNDDAPEPEIEE